MEVSVRETCGHPMECPTVPWDRGMLWTIPLSHGTMGWDGMDSGTHTSVEGQVDILWNVPLSHGTAGWDGQFTAFLDIYDMHVICCIDYVHVIWYII